MKEVLIKFNLLLDQCEHYIQNSTRANLELKPGVDKRVKKEIFGYLIDSTKMHLAIKIWSKQMIINNASSEELLNL